VGQLTFEVHFAFL